MAVPFEVTVQDAHSAISNGAVLIDVREPWEHAQRHIEGAILIPLNDLPNRLEEIPPDRDIYVHCRSGGRSAKAVEYLRQAGRPRSVNVGGGIDAWTTAGLPVE